MGTRRWKALAILAAVLLAMAACGGDEEAPAGGGGGDGEADTTVTAVLPIDSPNVYGFKVAEQLDYYEEEGVDGELQYVDGSGEAIQQLIAGRGDVAVVGTGTVLEALEEGHDDIRVIGNVNYGSVFFLTVPEDSDIQSPEDLDGKTVGITELSGGEVPVVRGIIRSAGLNPQTDVQLVPIGTGTALAVRAIEQGQVDAFGGSINDIVAIEVQGLALRRILPEILKTLPGLPVVTTESVLSEKRDAVVGFMRAMTKGQEFGQANPDAATAILEETNPEQFTDETGSRIFEGVLPLWQAPEGQMFGETTPEQWEQFADFTGAELPEGADFSDIILPDVVEEANDYDHEAVQQQAEEYPTG